MRSGVLFEGDEAHDKILGDLRRDFDPRDTVESLYVADIARCVREAARARSAAREILNAEATRQCFEAYVVGKCVAEERTRGPLAPPDRVDIRREAEVEFQAALCRGDPGQDGAVRQAISRVGLTTQMILDRAYWSTVDQTEKLHRIAFHADQQRMGLAREIERRRAAVEERRRPASAAKGNGQGFFGGR